MPPSIHVGPAGWSYEDWKGCVYPPHPSRRFDPLAWIARFFDLVEINASFYRVPPARQAESWLRRVESRPSFRFALKLHQTLTHGERRLDGSVIAALRDLWEPLRQEGRLAPVLAQFPWSFRPSESALGHLARLREAFPDVELVAELRHGRWEAPEARERVRTLGLTLASIDQPQIGESLPPRLWEGKRPYLRLHGRNRGSWFDREAGRDARYDYLYAREELQEWTDRILALGSGAETLHVVTNNHFRGKAVVNALELKALLALPVEEIPRWLVEEVPDLLERLRELGATPTPVEPEEIVSTPPPAQGDLFG